MYMGNNYEKAYTEILEILKYNKIFYHSSLYFSFNIKREFDILRED